MRNLTVLSSGIRPLSGYVEEEIVNVTLPDGRKVTLRHPKHSGELTTKTVYRYKGEIWVER